MLMGATAGGGGRSGRSGGGGDITPTNGDAGQPGEVVREANKARIAEILNQNVAKLKAMDAGLNNMNKALADIESGGRFNYGQKDFKTWQALNTAAINASRQRSILRIRTKNIYERYKNL